MVLSVLIDHNTGKIKKSIIILQLCSHTYPSIQYMPPIDSNIGLI